MAPADKTKLDQLTPAAQVPQGGATGQILAKTSGANWDTGWVDPPATGEVLSFLNAGSGAGTFKSKVGTTVSFRSLVGSSSAIQFTAQTDTVALSISNATPTAAGLMSSADKAKLDGLNDPPASTDPNYVPYGRVFVDGVARWEPVSRADHTHEVTSLSDVDIDSGPSPALVHWDGTQLRWRPPLSTTELADVSTTTPSDGYVLAWNASTQKYVPTPQLQASSTVTLGTELVGPTTVGFDANMLGKIIPVDLSAGDVEVQFDAGVTHPANTVVYSQFRIKPTVLSGAKLRFRGQTGVPQTPVLHAHLLGGKGSNVGGTAITTWQPEGSEKYTLNVPAGDNLALVIVVSTHTATLGTAPTITATLDGTSITLTSFSGFDYTRAVSGPRYYVAPLGNLSSSTNKILRITDGTNVNCYAVYMMVFSGVNQSTPIADPTPEYEATSTAAVTYNMTASAAGGLLVYCADRSHASGSTAPTTSGATQIAWTNINTGANRGAATIVLATEEVLSSGPQDATVTWAAAQNSAAMMFVVKGTGGAAFPVRTANNVQPDIGDPNEFITVIYNSNTPEALVVF
jgi:hypothetical protein